MNLSGKLDASKIRVAIVVSRWNELVTKALLEGAQDTLSSMNAKDPLVIWVPGTWEIPVAVKGLLKAKKADAVVALGCILQGQTPHAKLLAGDVGSALMSLQVEYGIPVAWGVLTPDDQDQALDRSGLKMGNKGREAASAAVEMASLLKQIAD